MVAPPEMRPEPLAAAWSPAPSSYTRLEPGQEILLLDGTPETQGTVGRAVTAVLTDTLPPLLGTSHMSSHYWLLLLLVPLGTFTCPNPGCTPTLTGPLTQISTHLSRSHGFPFRNLLWKGRGFGSSSSCLPFETTRTRSWNKEFWLQSKQKIPPECWVHSSFIPHRVQMVTFLRQRKKQDSQAFYLVLARLRVMVLWGKAATDGSTF